MNRAEEMLGACSGTGPVLSHGHRQTSALLCPPEFWQSRHLLHRHRHPSAMPRTTEVLRVSPPAAPRIPQKNQQQERNPEPGLLLGPHRAPAPQQSCGTPATQPLSPPRRAGAPTFSVSTDL